MPRTTYIRGEILPLQSEYIGALENASDEQLTFVAAWLDDRFEGPGTRIRFGLDALIGWIPGIGDALAAFASAFIVVAAWKRGATRITLIRMLMNVLVAGTCGEI